MTKRPHSSDLFKNCSFSSLNGTTDADRRVRARLTDESTTTNKLSSESDANNSVNSGASGNGQATFGSSGALFSRDTISGYDVDKTNLVIDTILANIPGSQDTSVQIKQLQTIAQLSRQAYSTYFNYASRTMELIRRADNFIEILSKEYQRRTGQSVPATTQQPAVATAQPPTVVTTQQLAVATAQPPTVATTQPPTVAAQPPLQQYTQRPLQPYSQPPCPAPYYPPYYPPYQAPYQAPYQTPCQQPPLLSAIQALIEKNCQQPTSASLHTLLTQYLSQKKEQEPVAESSQQGTSKKRPQLSKLVAVQKKAQKAAQKAEKQQSKQSSQQFPPQMPQTPAPKPAQQRPQQMPQTPAPKPAQQRPQQMPQTPAPKPAQQRPPQTPQTPAPKPAQQRPPQTPQTPAPKPAQQRPQQPAQKRPQQPALPGPPKPKKPIRNESLLQSTDEPTRAVKFGETTPVRMPANTENNRTPTKASGSDRVLSEKPVVVKSEAGCPAPKKVGNTGNSKASGDENTEKQSEQSKMLVMPWGSKVADFSSAVAQPGQQKLVQTHDGKALGSKT